MTRILFVCLGNICRSPLAEGILKRQASEAGVDVEVDSAAIGHWHVGDLPDPRAIRVGVARGCDMSMRARQVTSADFERFDLLVAADRSIVKALGDLPKSRPEKVKLMRSFDPNADGDEVPDPYYGSMADFEEVAEMTEAACHGIVQAILHPETS